jgi:hypothetical protein
MKVVYFVQDTRGGGEVLMGVARKARLEKHLQTVQLGNPAELKLLGIIPTRNARALVRELRATYSTSHVRGHWFKPVPDLMQFIRSRAVIP